MASVDLTVAWAAGPVSDPGRYRLAPRTDPTTGIEGGQGFVWRAERSTDGRQVALKQLTDMRPEEWPLFQARAQLIGQITHPNLVGHVETFLGPALHNDTPPPPEDFDLAYVVTDWVPGHSFADSIEAVPIGQALRWVRDTGHAAALHHHGSDGIQGVLHRDIKPSNVRVSDGRAVLIDLGIADPWTAAR